MDKTITFKQYKAPTFQNMIEDIEILMDKGELSKDASFEEIGEYFGKHVLITENVKRIDNV